ncbi:hypothetical protein APUTEX25_005273 [Auxenochlorella protothecoides]|uniref:Uncharacterized protein n=1 Tax=Auxenochlorella protothecoides TaxID=3075 RepID=A0A3M7KTV9_AUXPR|nr:hypothetical protein APUTEX25_005273 [Auxenochlorella protothecoides]|eukprot:RMZ53284.1 hypothetical protein APUTEX25_005273 [Auxenochlorella protothecoides]
MRAAKAASARCFSSAGLEGAWEAGPAAGCAAGVPALGPGAAGAPAVDPGGPARDAAGICGGAAVACACAGCDPGAEPACCAWTCGG